MEKVAIALVNGYTTNRNKHNVSNFEMFNIAKVLSKMFQVDILTGKQCDGCISVDENFDINKYSRLFIVNSTVSNPSGLESKCTQIITMYKLMHKFENKLYYILTDAQLTYKDYWMRIHTYDWSDKYNKQMFTNKGFTVLSQFKQLNKVTKNNYCKKYLYINWPLYSLENSHTVDNKYPEVDLIYGGACRSHFREAKMLDYFFDRDINVELYGSIKLKNFKDDDYNKPPKFSPKVKADEILDKNSTALATIIIGDKNYNNNTVTLRFYESILSGTITFIDNDFDPEHKLLKDDYFYVNNGDELEDKIKELKRNRSLVDELKKRQFDCLPKDKLSDILKEVLLNN